MALLIGFALVALLGAGHHFALVGLRHVTLRADARARPYQSIIPVFVGLVAIHLTEILAFAAAYAVLLSWHGTGALDGSDGGWHDLVYFSGINFTTLGHTRIEPEGPIRLISMMQSLGGFMILTWSATFIYTVWKRALEER